MRVVAFAGDVWEHACPTLRIVKPLLAAGIDLIRGNEWIEQRLLVRTNLVEKADVVLIQRDFALHVEAYEEIIVRARSAGKPIVYDIDDLLFELPENHPDFARYQSGRIAVLRAIAEADLVTVSTRTLQAFLEPLNPNIRVLPNCLPDDLWLTKSPLSRMHKAKNNLTIGFVGSHTHVADLDLIAPAIAEVLNEIPGARFISWGCPLPSSLAPIGEFIPLQYVNYADFASFLLNLSCDILVAPLVESTFNACKSALKFLEYSAIGVSTVCSSWGEFREVVTHGHTGLLASSLTGWKDCLSMLVADPQLRSQLAQEAYSYVKGQRLLSKNIWRWQELFAALQGDRLPSKSYSPVLSLATKLHIHDVQSLQSRQRILEAQVSQLQADNQALHANISQLQANNQELQRVKLELQNQLASLSQAYNESIQRLRWAEERLSAIESGPGWQLLAKLWPLRRALIPPGSLREHLFKQFIAKLTGNRIISNSSATERQFSLTSAQQSEIQESISSCQEPITPRLALVVLAAPQDLNPVIEWIESQTWKADIVIFYDPSRAQVYDPQTGHSTSKSLFSLLEGLDVRYVGFVTPAHSKLRQTFVEENIITLESESLAFTANCLSPVVASGEIRSLPSAFAFVHKDRLSCDVNGQLVLHISDMNNKTVGKFIAINLFSGNEPATLEIELDSAVTMRGAYATTGDAQSIIASRCPLDHLHPEVALLDRGKPVVILVMPFIAVGGAERVALDMMRALQSDIEFVVVATDPAIPDAGSMVDAFRKVVGRTYVLEDFLHPDLRISFFRYLIRSLSPSALYVANGSIWIYDQLLPALKREFPSLRIVNQVYDHVFGWIEFYNSTLIQQIDGHIGPNKRICEEFARRGVPEKNIFLVEHGIDTSEFDPSRYTSTEIAHLRQKLGIPAEKQVITFIGRFHPQKRPMDFVELARSLSENSRLFFLMVGDGPLSRIVDSEIKRLGLTNLRRLGFYQPSRDIFAISDLIVLPSEYEGMPLVVLEAQAMGKPVVATDVGNNREVLSTTGGGIVVSRIGDTRALRRAVLEALEKPVEPAKLRQAVQSHFDWQVVAPKYRAALLGLSA